MTININYPIDIFVICYEPTPVLQRCLDSVAKCTVEVEHRLTVIQGKRSASENRNAALSEVSSPWFVMMDDDVIVTCGWLSALLACAGTGVGQIQSKLLFPNGRVFAAEKVFTNPWGDNIVIGMGEEDEGQFDYVRTCEMLSGTCCLYNAKILESCSFDMNYRGAQWEDCDFSMQILKNGFQLIYCGTSTVYHHNLYREAKKENYAYFQRKWFCERSITQRGVMYIGLACDIDCVFCYYKHSDKKSFRNLDELKEEATKFKVFYGNSRVDITGGEPTIYPYLVPLVEHCHKIGLKPSIITHGQRLSRDLVVRLKRAGVEDFLVSYHGIEVDHDLAVQKAGGYRAMRSGVSEILGAGLTFRTNTVVTNLNYPRLPHLAAELLDLKPKIVNLIMFNPFEEWIFNNRESFQVSYSATVPFVREAVLMLSAGGIEVNVRYLPFCLSAGIEKHVMNFPQLAYDEWEWNYKNGTPDLGEYEHLYYQLRESRVRYAQGPPCARCSLMLICSGLPKQYDRVFGWGELHPQEGMLIRDPLYFKSFKASATTVNAASHVPLNEFVTIYPTLKETDPLINQQLAPMDQTRSVTCRRANHSWVANFARRVGGSVAGPFLMKCMPLALQKFVYRLLRYLYFLS